MPEEITGRTRPEDFRPLTVLNADFKLLVRIIANRKRPWINDLHPSQHCGVQDNNILGAISAIRDTIAHAELTHASYRWILRGHSTTLPTRTYSR